MVNEIESRLREKVQGKEVESQVIGELVIKALKKLDKVAYIRFASVYKDFQDIEDFRNSIKEISDSHREFKNSRGFKKEIKEVK